MNARGVQRIMRIRYEESFHGGWPEAEACFVLHMGME